MKNVFTRVLINNVDYFSTFRYLRLVNEKKMILKFTKNPALNSLIFKIITNYTQGQIQT